MININLPMYERLEELYYKGKPNYVTYGAYPIKILDVTDTGKALIFKVDIVKGCFAYYYSNKYKNDLSEWNHEATLISSYTDNSLPYFKANIKAIEDSNPNFNAIENEFNPDSFIGLYVIGVFEFYYYKNEETQQDGVAFGITGFRSIEDWKNDKVVVLPPRNNFQLQDTKYKKDNVYKKKYPNENK